eukprot:TRINITY_DN68520_c0_g1_i1.p1 TRINITY_DN68520_c0_g1~~TRINITY_DN68520_c0_g1_i1.p1  ORF type:complete len:233 (-),score=20.98 TRINITY_DN68520_c0_g1_i1:244-942(-)
MQRKHLQEQVRRELIRSVEGPCVPDPNVPRDRGESSPSVEDPRLTRGRRGRDVSRAQEEADALDLEDNGALVADPRLPRSPPVRDPRLARGQRAEDPRLRVAEAVDTGRGLIRRRSEESRLFAEEVPALDQRRIRRRSEHSRVASEEVTRVSNVQRRQFIEGPSPAVVGDASAVVERLRRRFSDPLLVTEESTTIQDDQRNQLVEAEYDRIRRIVEDPRLSAEEVVRRVWRR